jgi:hypothetical protein
MNTPKSIAIGTTTIHQSDNGLFDLSKLWAACGKHSTNNPEIWTNKDIGGRIFNALLDEHETDGRVLAGDNQQVCYELALNYYMWASPFAGLRMLQFLGGLSSGDIDTGIILCNMAQTAIEQPLINKSTTRDIADLYVIEFSTRVIKVGVSKNATKRITQHLNNSKSHDVSIINSFFMESYADNERNLIDYCCNNGKLYHGLEYFKELSFYSVKSWMISNMKVQQATEV